MKSHRRILLFLVFLLLPLVMHGAEELLVYKKGLSAPAYSIFLAEKPQISFGSDGITLRTAKSAVTLLSMHYTEVDRCVFEENNTGEPTVTDIEEAPQVQPALLRLSFTDGRTVRFDGVADDARLSLYGTDGRSIPADVERGDGRATFHLDALPRGIYMIRVGSQSFKIYKKQ